MKFFVVCFKEDDNIHTACDDCMDMVENRPEFDVAEVTHDTDRVCDFCGFASADDAHGIWEEE